MHHKGHLFNGLAHVVAVRVAAVAAVKEQYIDIALFHCHAQTAEVHLCLVQRAEQRVDKFVIAAGLAALHGHDASAGTEDIVGQSLKENKRAYGLDAVGIA